MYKSKLVLILWFLLTSTACNAATNVNKIELQCTVSMTNYNDVDHSSMTKNVSLEALKHKKGGTVLVSQTDNYEFWVMTHGQQTINNVTFFNNFQVAIKDKKTDLFMHALSDTSHKPNKKPSTARISLIEYNSGSFLEEGELIFECTTIAE